MLKWRVASAWSVYAILLLQPLQAGEAKPQDVFVDPRAVPAEHLTKKPDSKSDFLPVNVSGNQQEVPPVPAADADPKPIEAGDDKKAADAPKPDTKPVEAPSVDFTVN